MGKFLASGANPRNPPTNDEYETTTIEERVTTPTAHRTITPVEAVARLGWIDSAQALVAHLRTARPEALGVLRGRTVVFVDRLAGEPVAADLPGATIVSREVM